MALNLWMCDQKGHDLVTAPPCLLRPFTSNGYINHTRRRHLLITGSWVIRGFALPSEGY